jgi:hypothetical protein
MSTAESETRWQEIIRLSCEIDERKARIKHLLWAARQAGEVREVGTVYERLDHTCNVAGVAEPTEPIEPRVLEPGVIAADVEWDGKSEPLGAAVRRMGLAQPLVRIDGPPTPHSP